MRAIPDSLRSTGLRAAAALACAALALGACGGKLLDEPSGRGVGWCADADCDDPNAEGGARTDASTERDGGDRTDGGSLHDGGTCESGPGARFVTGVVDHWFGPGQNHNQVGGFPEVLYGPPHAGNASAVVSLGNGGWVVVEFAGNAIIDGPGVDFTVFENPFGTFRELATVAVSEDGITWHEFPCTAGRGATDFGYCAGVNPVLSTPTNGVDPLDPRVSGGDSYDLSDMGVARARYVRITDRADLVGDDGVFDLDAVAIVNAECP
jgi:hypothetical protein